jgi:TatD DNase family protein
MQQNEMIDRAVYQPNLIGSEIPLSFFDSHCHFDFAEFDQSRDIIWSDAQSMGVNQLLIPSVSPGTWKKARLIAENHKGIYWAAGLHPWWIANYVLIPDWETELKKLLEVAQQDKNCIAIGETGLDALIDTSLDIQIRAFELQLEAASQFSKPVIVHSRKTHADLFRIIKNFHSLAGGVVHAFSGSYEQAKLFVDAGFYLGVGGVITYERANKTRDAIKKIPLEYLLLETDAPDMPLQGEQGKINSPTHLLRIANHLAELKQQSLDLIARVTTENANRLFGISNAV